MVKLLIGSIALILFILINFSKQSNDDEFACGDVGWRYSPHNQKCYKLFSERTGWTVAEYKCVFMGAHHISIHDFNDNTFVSELARQAGIVWLGSAQFGTSQSYVWSDGTPFSFEHWKDGRRPNYHRGKKCSKLDGRTGEWLQSCCKVPAASICQKPANRPIERHEAIIEDPLEPSEMEAEMKKSNPNDKDFRGKAMRFKQ